MFPSVQQEFPPSMRLVLLLCGEMLSEALHTVAEFSLADLVKDGPRSVSQLAKATETDEANLYRLLRALACLDIFSQPEPGYFGPTELSAFLQSDHPQTLYYLALMTGCGWQSKALKGLPYSIRTGEPAIHHIYGKSLQQHFAEDDPEAGRLYNQAMKSWGGPVDKLIADAYDFSSVCTLVDVGGGLGGFLVTVLKNYPHLKGILFDRPQVIEHARKHISKEGLAHRCELVGGNSFEEVPAGGDAYFMRQVIKDWKDEECKQILRNCVRAMNPGGRILVAEQVLGPSTADPLGKILDLVLVVASPGHEREESEFRKLFIDAGLAMISIIPTHSPYKLIEGVSA